MAGKHIQYIVIHFSNRVFKRKCLINKNECANERFSPYKIHNNKCSLFLRLCIESLLTIFFVRKRAIVYVFIYIFFSTHF